MQAVQSSAVSQAAQVEVLPVKPKDEKVEKETLQTQATVSAPQSTESVIPTLQELLALAQELESQKPTTFKGLQNTLVSWGKRFSGGEKAVNLYKQTLHASQVEPLRKFAVNHRLDVDTVNKALDICKFDLRNLMPTDDQRAELILKVSAHIADNNQRVTTVSKHSKVKKAVEVAFATYKEVVGDLIKQRSLSHPSEKEDLIGDFTTYDLDQSRQAFIDLEIKLRKLEKEAAYLALKKSQGQLLLKFNFIFNEISSLLSDSERTLANDDFQRGLIQLLASIDAAKKSIATGDLAQITQAVQTAEKQYELLQEKFKGLESLKAKIKQSASAKVSAT
jgi:hypothetical protein